MKNSTKKFIASLKKFSPVAHRGASREYPANTIIAFKRALEIFPDCMLEMDVHCTKDGKIIVMHDNVLDITTNGKGFVKDHTLNDIKNFDAGYNITFDNGATYPFRNKGFGLASLNEVLDTFPNAKMSIDIKDNNLTFAKDVLSLIKEKGAAERVIIGSFHNRIMKFVRKNFPEIATSFGKSEVIFFYLFHKLQKIKYYTCRDNALLIPEFFSGDKPEYDSSDPSQRFRLITEKFIQDAHGKGIPVFAWTINDKENMKRLIQWGIDGIITDYPDRLKQVMVEEGVN